jgi:hypothetical protein
MVPPLTRPLRPIPHQPQSTNLARTKSQPTIVVDDDDGGGGGDDDQVRAIFSTYCDRNSPDSVGLGVAILSNTDRRVKAYLAGQVVFDSTIKGGDETARPTGRMGVYHIAMDDVGRVLDEVMVPEFVQTDEFRVLVPGGKGS